VWLLLLAAAVVVFSFGITTWVSLAAAFAAGVAALGTGAVTQTQLVRLRPRYAASVMALWAICWAGSKPLASLVDGGLASVLPHLWMAAALLALPAVLLAGTEIVLPRKAKDSITRKAKGRTVLGVHVGLTPAPEPGSLDDRQPILVRSGHTNGTKEIPVNNVLPHYRLAHRQLIHGRARAPATNGTSSPSHHRPAH
jgi:hypothetical protein